MAVINNPRKAFQFSVQIVGMTSFEPMLCQEITLPDKDTEQVIHGDTNFDVKTPGRIKLGNFTMDKIMRANGADNLIWNWGQQCQDSAIGGGLPPASIWYDILVKEFAENGVTVINEWLLKECWPTKVNGQKFSRVESNNSIESLEFSVNEMFKS